ncbi:hypothetical protein K493DRAFT_403777 [Basidiobolus meristosporus CBS 931.73]|uniref:BZIP domain-containing protein n=1 Tax=Basidiobolus meristosporus CBS 931.73 TaxID=1314790 RepID=A0A1Y1ZB53_9FUNG|nr:hypothetical protein K493DRAFT_403777 [Basidiobolus meristosporus CBS 931.73]|eukprot:ORY07207.1 hypothetical protein K493DRAFT_403777 [Basidiobolus meristosporus CBS 931.73]
MTLADTPQVQQTGKFAYGLLDLSRDQEFHFSENPKVVHQTDKAHHKKPGRKPLTNIPDSKRKAQILTAQRAFRERKKCYIEDLESKVKNCEHTHDSTITSLQKELLALKERLAHLEKENQSLKATESVIYSQEYNDTLSFPANTSPEAFKGLPVSYQLTQLPTLSGPLISDLNSPVPSVPELGPTQYEDPYQVIPSLDSYSVSLNPIGASRVNILSSSLNSEPAHLSESDPSTHSLSDLPKTPNDLREPLKYLEPEFDRPLCPPIAPVTGSEPSGCQSKRKGCCGSKSKPPTECEESLPPVIPELPKISCGCDFEVPCIPKNADEAALCESLTCVAVGVPATSVSTDRLVLELEEGEANSCASTHRKYIGARDLWEKFSAQPEFAHLSIDSLCKQLKSKIKVINGCNGEKRHVIIPEDEVTAAFERLHLSGAN